ncbi:MAG: efflux RND transporter periplasmic adaptor subunit [Hyphomicrobiales bacterium]
MALLGMAGCESQSTPAPPPPPKVTVSLPVRQAVTDSLEATGKTQAVNSVQLVARVEGYLQKVFFGDGEIVRKGQLLFQIQQDTYRAMLKQAEGNVQAQKARIEHARIELARNTDLYKQRAAAQTEVESWRFQLDSAQADLMAAEAQRDLAELNLGYTSITAPFDGRIDRRLVDPGNLVGPGSATSPPSAAGAAAASVLAQITQVDPLYVYFNVSETEISALAGVSALLHGKESDTKHPVYIGLADEDGYPHEGYLDFASPSVSSTTGTLLMRAVVPNADGKLLPGQYARVRVPVGKEKSAILVPKVAVGFDQEGSYVLVVNEKNTVERRNVITGASHGDRYAIHSGLNGTERVIVKGLLRGIPGRQVTPEAVEGE